MKPKSQLQTIRCRGTKSSGDPCGAVVCETNGKEFYIQGLALEIDPARVKCDVCGYITRLRFERSAEK